MQLQINNMVADRTIIHEMMETCIRLTEEIKEIEAAMDGLTPMLRECRFLSFDIRNEVLMDLGNKLANRRNELADIRKNVDYLMGIQ